ncbi:MAG: CHAT domain-containing protein [Balneolales bacterium]|nr:CHAT domain-containing protein [Balneolales bacterium]
MIFKFHPLNIAFLFALFLTCSSFQHNQAHANGIGIASLNKIKNGELEEQDLIKLWTEVVSYIPTDSLLASGVSATKLRNNILDIQAELFFAHYLKIKDSRLLNFALHTASRSDRIRMLSQLGQLPDDPKLPLLIEKLIDRNMPAELLAVRDFSLHDVYLFQNIRLQTEQLPAASSLLKHWSEQLKSSQSIYDENIRALLLQNLVHGYFRTGQLNEVVRYGEKLLESYDLPDSYTYLTVLDFITYGLLMNGRYMDALAVYRYELIPLTNRLNDPVEKSKHQLGLGTTLTQIGNHQAAIEVYITLIEEGQAFLSANELSILYNNLATALYNTGDLKGYIRYQLEAYDLAEALELPEQQLHVLRNLSIFYRQFQDPGTESEYLNQALKIAEENGFTAEISPILVSLGIMQRNDFDNPESALQYFYQALELSVENNLYRNTYNAMIEIASTHEQTGNNESAISYFVQAAELAKAREDRGGQVSADIRIANNFVQRGSYEDAENYLGQVTEEDARLLRFEFYILYNLLRDQVNLGLCSISAECNNELLTASLLERSEHRMQNINNWLQGSVDTQTGQIRMHPNFSASLGFHLILASKSGDTSSVIFVTEQLRAAGRDLFFNNPLLKSQLLNENELVQLHSLDNRIQRLRNQLATESSDEVRINNQILTAISSRNALLSRGRTYTGIETPNQLQSLQNQLKDDQLILLYTVAGKILNRVSISRNFIQTTQLDTAGAFNLNLEKALQTLQPGNTNLILFSEVYETLFAGIDPSDFEDLFIIPDQQLFSLPFSILPVNKPSGAHHFGSVNYLAENNSIAYFSSLTDLYESIGKEQSRNRSSGHTVNYVGFGVRTFSGFESAGRQIALPDLPFSGLEIKQNAAHIEPLKRTNAHIFLDENATLENFRAVAPLAEVLHLATHSFIDKNNPLHSSLHFYRSRPSEQTVPSVSLQDTSEIQVASTIRDASNDNILHMHQLFTYNLSSELVILSSCESAGGNILQGTGVLGFSRALFYAGAGSILMNAWAVRDHSAATITSRFMEELTQGEAKHKALRSAQLAYLNEINSDPYYWGPFIIFGNTNPVFKQDRKFSFSIQKKIATAAVTLLLLIALLKVYQANSARGV